MYLMKNYDDTLRRILNEGVKKEDRTGVGTLALFGVMNRYNLQEGFPLLTGREISFEAMVGELLWFISGSTNNETLKSLGCNFWTPWVSEEFEKKHGFAKNSFGPVYGFQLRHFGGNYNQGAENEAAYGAGGFDQLDWLVKEIKQNPTSRRLLFSLWNPNQVDSMRLPPCHLYYQVFVDTSAKKLDGLLVQRSCDFPIGVPFNIAFYSLLTMLLAQQTGYTAKELIHVTNDSHIYLNQISAVSQYLERDKPDSPRIKIDQAADIFSYGVDNFELLGYKPKPKMKIPVAV